MKPDGSGSSFRRILHQDFPIIIIIIIIIIGETAFLSRKR
jgi:hypothetical protein